ncbi:hypothetical protein StoSoilA2_35790 [Arthrobacter sp. StoSoilA2]|nr:hypothetical protein StoSoilA2_35790 [Arthrobacter sp. StoSoilA2]
MGKDVIEVAGAVGGHFEVETARLSGLAWPGLRVLARLRILTWLRRRLVALGWLVTLRWLVTRRRNIAGLRRLGAGLLRLWCFVWVTHGITLDRRLRDA